MGLEASPDTVEDRKISLALAANRITNNRLSSLCPIATLTELPWLRTDCNLLL